MGKSVNVNLDELINLYNQGLSDQKIADKLNISRKIVSRRRNRLGLPVNFWGTIDTELSKKIIEMFSEGKSGGEICRTLHLSSTTIVKFKKKYGIKSAFEMKLTEEDKEKITELANQGMMDSQIAKLLKVSRADIFSIRKKRGIKTKFDYSKISKIKKEDYEDLVKQGLNVKEIARKLNVSEDSIYSFRIRNNYKREKLHAAKNNPLTQDNLEVILGIMMGDASMECKYLNARMSFAHCPKQKEYTYYLAEKLSNLKPHIYYHKSKPHKITGKCYESYWCDFAANPAFNTIYESFYKNGTKRIPIELFNNFTWQSLAYMYMDDGSKTLCGGQLATNCFNKEELQEFCDFLKEKFNIETTICKSKVLYIKAKSFRYMKSMIEPYMCECMKYKIK